MSEKKLKAVDIAEELGLYLKVTLSTKSFAVYNSFYNIFGDTEEPCRRILVLTPYEDLEEVEDYNNDRPIEKYSIVDGNMWIEEYPLTVSPKEINLEEIYIPQEAYEKLKTICKK